MFQIAVALLEDAAEIKNILVDYYAEKEGYLDLWFGQYFAPEHFLCAKEDGRIVAVLPFSLVEYEGKTGKYLHGVMQAFVNVNPAVQIALLQEAEVKSTKENDSFLITLFQNEKNAAIYKENGFVQQTTIRRLHKVISPDLLAYAEQDSVTAAMFKELREQYIKNAITFTSQEYPFFFASLYSNNGTVIKTDGGYGVYFREKDTLIFAELFAKTQRSAEKIVQAARNITGCFEAEILLEAANSELFLGEGKREPHALIKSLSGDTTNWEDCYFNLLTNI